jgi:hypothetical protein
MRLVARLHQQKAPEAALRGIEATAVRAINDRAPCIAHLKATISWLTMSGGIMKPRPMPTDICAISDYGDQCQATIERYRVPVPPAE